MQSSFDKSISTFATGVQLPQIDAKEIVEAVKIVAKEENLKVTLKYSGATGAITGISTVIGGALLIPFGLTPLGCVIGAGIGSLTSFRMFKNKYISLYEIINQLPSEEKDKLVQHIKKGLQNTSFQHVVALVVLLNSKDRQLFEILKALLIQYVVANGHAA